MLCAENLPAKREEDPQGGRGDVLFEGKEREETRKVRGGELFWGGVAPSRGIVGALLRRSQAFSGILRCSQSFPVIPSHSQSIARH